MVTDLYMLLRFCVRILKYHCFSEPLLDPFFLFFFFLPPFSDGLGLLRLPLVLFRFGLCSFGRNKLGKMGVLIMIVGGEALVGGLAGEGPLTGGLVRMRCSRGVGLRSRKVV